MFLWLLEGYFSVGLPVRAADGPAEFLPLIHLTQRLGRLPFHSPHIPHPPLSSHPILAALHSSTLQTPPSSRSSAPTPVPADTNSFPPLPSQPDQHHQLPYPQQSLPAPSGGGSPLFLPVQPPGNPLRPSPNPSSGTSGQPNSPSPGGGGGPYQTGSDAASEESLGDNSFSGHPPPQLAHPLPGHPGSFAIAYHPAGLPPMPLVLPSNTADPRHLDEVQRHLADYRRFIEAEMYKLQLAREALPRKTDACSQTPEPQPGQTAATQTCEARGAHDSVSSASQTGPPSLRLSDLRQAFATIGITLLDA